MAKQNTLNMTEPRLEQRAEQPYAAVPTRVKLRTSWGGGLL